MREEIVINILPDGEMEIDARGFKGKQCKDSTKFLEELGEVKSVSFKPEYRENDNKIKRKNYLR